MTMSRVSSRCCLGSLVVVIAGLIAPVSQASDTVYYGGIEIGAKGIKVVAVPIGDDGSPDLAHKIDRLPHKAVNNVTLGDLRLTDPIVRRRSPKPAPPLPISTNSSLWT